MNTPDANQSDSVWPPAIHADEPPVLVKTETKSNWISVGCGSAALGLWLSGIAVLIFVPDQVLNKVWIVTTLNVVLIGGPMLALSGVVLGALNRRTKSGRNGLILSLLVLTVMGSLLIANRITSSQWLWFQQGGFDDSCGCDGSG